MKAKVIDFLGFFEKKTLNAGEKTTLREKRIYQRHSSANLEQFDGKSFDRAILQFPYRAIGGFDVQKNLHVEWNDFLFEYEMWAQNKGKIGK